MTEHTTESWDNFTGSNFLKSDNIADTHDAVVVVNVEVSDDETGSRPRLTVQHGGDDYLFDLNVTNATFCKNNGIKKPKDLIGKKVYFKKVFVNNPKTKKEVESLRVLKIE